jgi:hypothetical protein
MKQSVLKFKKSGFGQFLENLLIEGGLQGTGATFLEGTSQESDLTLS